MFYCVKINHEPFIWFIQQQKAPNIFYQTKPIIIVRSSFVIIWYCCHLTNRFRDCKITNFQNVFDNKKYLNVIIIFYIRSFIYYLCIVVPSVKTNNIRFFAFTNQLAYIKWLNFRYNNVIPYCASFYTTN